MTNGGGKRYRWSGRRGIAITELERGLDKDREFLESAIDTLEDIFIVFDLSGELLHWNRSALKITGYRSEEVAGMSITDFFDTSERERVFSTVATGIQTGYASIEFGLVCKDGRSVPFEFYGTPLHDDDGDTIAVTAIGRNITERIALMEREQEIAVANAIKEELESRVEERTAQLEDANKELESFSYSISHDLRSPLRAITSFSHIVMEKNSADLDNEARRLLDLVVQNAERMEELIKGLLEFSRMGRQEMRMSRIDMEELADDVFVELTTGAPGRQVDFKLARLPAARGDRLLIHQVLSNLISNAIKFTAKEEKPRIEIGSRAEAEANVYWVKDNGVGFNTRYADKLFKVFSRLHSSDDFEGTGIGLANVQRILHRHGGRAWAESELGQGATFYFTLPGTGP